MTDVGRFRLLGRAPEPPEDGKKSRTSAARLRAAAGHTAPVERGGLSGAAAYPTSTSTSGGHPAAHPAGPNASTSGGYPSAPGGAGGPGAASGAYPAGPRPASPDGYPRPARSAGAGPGQQQPGAAGALTGSASASGAFAAASCFAPPGTAARPGTSASGGYPAAGPTSGRYRIDHPGAGGTGGHAPSAPGRYRTDQGAAGPNTGGRPVGPPGPHPVRPAPNHTGYFPVTTQPPNGSPVARADRPAEPPHTGSFPEVTGGARTAGRADDDRVPALVGAPAAEPAVTRSGAHHAADRVPVGVGAHTAPHTGGFPAVTAVPGTAAAAGGARPATTRSGAAPSAAARSGHAPSTTGGFDHAVAPPRAGSDGAAVPRWAGGPGGRPTNGAGRRYPGDPPTEPFGYPPVAGPAAGARSRMPGPPPLPDRAEASALAAAFAVDYLSWDEDDLPRRGRVLRGYLPATAEDPARLGWSGWGRQRAEFALVGRVWPDGDGRVLVDVRVRVTPYRAVGDRQPAPPEPEPDLAGMPAAAPAPTGVGWRSLASCWIRLSVPVVLDGGRLLVDAWEELLGADLPPDTGRGAHTRDEPAPDDHALADDDPADVLADDPAERSLR